MSRAPNRQWLLRRRPQGLVTAADLELHSAGVPAIVSPHVGYALDMPPGIDTAAGDAWDGWCAAMQRTATHGLSCSREEYEGWEARQSRPIIDIVRRSAQAEGRAPSRPSGT